MAAEPLNNGQTILNGSRAKTPQITAPVVIYTLSTCPHCMEAKEYLTSNNIPFVNREVDSDDHNMEELMKIYEEMGVPEAKRGVPLIIIGNTIRLQGFNRDKVQEALQKVLKK
jgi:glutaredoxin